MLWDGLNLSSLIVLWIRGCVGCLMFLYPRVLYMCDDCVFMMLATS